MAVEVTVAAVSVAVITLADVLGLPVQAVKHAAVQLQVHSDAKEAAVATASLSGQNVKSGKSSNHRCSKASRFHVAMVPLWFGYALAHL